MQSWELDLVWLSQGPRERGNAHTHIHTATCGMWTHMCVVAVAFRRSASGMRIASSGCSARPPGQQLPGL